MTFQYNFKEDGDILYDTNVNENLAYELTTSLNYALDGATTTNQENLDIDFFTSDTASSAINFDYDAGNDWYETPDLSDTDDFFVIIEATSLTVGDFAINNCIAKEIATGKWVLYCTSGTAAVRRAQVYKTLFYGTNGTNDKVTGITSLTALKTSHANDDGKQAHYAFMNITHDADATVTYDGTFVDTSTNTNCSSWADGSVTSYGGAYNATAAWNLPTSTGLAAINVGLGTATFNETGTDRVADEASNPPDCRLHVSFNDSLNHEPPQVGHVKALIICSGDMTWVDNTLGEGTVTNTDFKTDHSVPNFIATTAQDDADVLTSTLISAGVTITPSESMGILKALTTIDSGSTLTVSVSYNNGSDYVTITEKEVYGLTELGTNLLVKFVVVRTDSSVEDRIRGYATYYS